MTLTCNMRNLSNYTKLTIVEFTVNIQNKFCKKKITTKQKELHFIAIIKCTKIKMKVKDCLFVGFIVFNTTFNNISVLLMEETRGPGENHQTATGH